MFCADSRMRHSVSNMAAGPEEQSGNGPTDLLPNSGHATLSTINHTGTPTQKVYTVCHVYILNILNLFCHCHIDLNAHLHISEGSPPLTNGSHVPGPQQHVSQTGVVASGPGRPAIGILKYDGGLGEINGDYI